MDIWSPRGLLLSTNVIFHSHFQCTWTLYEYHTRLKKRWVFYILTMLVILSEAQKCQIVIQKIYLDDKKCISRLIEHFINHFHAYSCMFKITVSKYYRNGYLQPPNMHENYQ